MTPKPTHSNLASAFMRGVSVLNLGLASISALVLLLATGIVFLEIMSRFFLGKSQLWVIEVSGYSLLYMTFLGAPYMLEKHRHVAIDILTDSLANPLRSRLAAFMNALAAIVCLVCTWFGMAVLLDQIEFGQRETSVLAPRSYWLTWVFPLGMSLLSIQFIAHSVTCWKDA
ncbi:MAG: TRAP transporter small permease [Saccharospirillum sp.]